VAAEDVAMTRAALAMAKIRMVETPLGPWTLFAFDQGAWDARYAGNRSLHWTGSGVLIAGSRALSLGLVQMADFLIQRDRYAAEELYREALRVLPQNKPAADRLADLLRKTGRPQEADATEKSAANVWLPAFPAAIEFHGGLQLLGLSVGALPIARGKQLHLQTYWRCPPGFQTDSLAAFVHFRQDSAQFQGDHPLEFSGQSEQPYPWVFILETAIAVPADIPVGSYQIELGAFSIRTGRRLSVQTELPSRQNAVLVPGRLEVK
jgi:hypothetical protein